jgi:hypothetical protein
MMGWGGGSRIILVGYCRTRAQPSIRLFRFWCLLISLAPTRFGPQEWRRKSAKGRIVDRAALGPFHFFFSAVFKAALLPGNPFFFPSALYRRFTFSCPGDKTFLYRASIASRTARGVEEFAGEGERTTLRALPILSLVEELVVPDAPISLLIT